MAASGRIQRRLALAIVLTALIPLLVAVVIANSMLQQSAGRFYRPEFAAHLDRSLGVYQELARAVKAAMRNAATAIAAREALRGAARDGDADGVVRELAEVFPQYPNLVSITVTGPEGEVLGRRDRGRPLNPETENQLEVLRPLGTGAEEEGPQLSAIFAADKARFEERDGMSEFVDAYRLMSSQQSSFNRTYIFIFALLLGITIVGAAGVGALVSRGVATRIGALARATRKVGAGDLTIRVPEEGADEVTDLATEFNRMVGEVETSRARIEYLQRMGAWQEMARRLAHEIKNPLTPIQLAVQEVHRRYEGGDENYKKLVDTTLEVVEDEVGTLRRLVTEFSDFARLPRAKLEQADLVEFLREQAEHLSLVEDGGRTEDGVVGIEPQFHLPEPPAPVYLDRLMFRRVLMNLIQNAAQAIELAGKKPGCIIVRVSTEGDTFIVDVDDDGPGIPRRMRSTIFDPYVTTKDYGTGLGLAITKKIVVEHGGTVAAIDSELGGARMRICLPRAGTLAADAARESQDWVGPSFASDPASDPASDEPN